MKGDRGASQKKGYMKDKIQEQELVIIYEIYGEDSSEGVYLHGKEEQVIEQRGSDAIDGGLES